MERRGSDVDSGQTRRRRFLAVAALVVAFAAGIWIGRMSSPDVAAPPGTVSPTAPSEQRRVVNGVPVGYAQTEQGAVEAATNFTRVMASVPDDTDAYLAAVETMAAPAWVGEARRLAQNGLRFLQDRYGVGGSFSFSPVRYRVASYSETAATIEIWGVTVASGPKIQGIEESWLTATLDLVWVSGDWRLAGQRSETGPTPELLQTEDATTVDQLEEFKDYGHAPSP